MSSENSAKLVLYLEAGNKVERIPAETKNPQADVLGRLGELTGARERANAHRGKERSETAKVAAQKR